MNARQTVIAKRWLTVFVLMTAQVAPVEAASLLERATLAGLAGIHVRVQDLDLDAERQGLTKAALQTQVELTLRRAGIRVLTVAEWLAAPGVPRLDLHVTTQPTQRGDLYAYSIDLRLRQDVTLLRDPAIRSEATTWFRGAMGTVGPPSRLATWLRERVRDTVDEFINDYLAANPTRPAGPRRRVP